MQAIQLASAFSALVGLVMHVVLIAVIASFGRRYRPDAYGPLLAWAIAGLVWMFFSYSLNYAIPLLVARGGLGTYENVFAARTVLGTFVNTALTLFFLYAIVKLFQPLKPI